MSAWQRLSIVPAQASGKDLSRERRKCMEYLVEGLMKVTWQQMVMYGIGILLIWLAVKKE